MREDKEALLGVESSVRGRHWRLRPIDNRMAEGIAQAHGLPLIIGELLAARGQTSETAPSYLDPRLRDCLPDPMSLKAMDKAVERTLAALEGGEKIAVFGDYDVDGATSSALLMRFFRDLDVALEVYIPDRMIEGYGPSIPAFEALSGEGVSLVITVDCGTLAYEPLAAAGDMKLDVIVLDHHKAEARLPEAVAIINPNRLDDDTGLGDLAAVGVTFLYLVALNRALRAKGAYKTRPEPDLMALLDIVALGTVADVVPLRGLNRALVRQGLKVMAGRQNPGLRALSDVARMDGEPTAYHCGFLLGPRVNAGGRVGNAEFGARLLASEDLDEVRALAGELNRFNLERREIEAWVEEEALVQVLGGLSPGETPSGLIFVAGEGWHPGVIGIVASRLKEKFNRPAIVLAVDKGIARGSARSISGVDMGAAVIEALQEGLLENGGGHPMAAGMTLKEDQLDTFRSFLEARLASKILAARALESFMIDGVLALGGATRALVDQIEEVGPFGSGNPAPRFLFPELKVAKADIVGQAHVRVFLEGRDGARMKGMAFRAADNAMGTALLTAQGKLVHMVGRLKADNWRGANKVELHLEDMAFTEPAPGGS